MKPKAWDTFAFRIDPDLDRKMRRIAKAEGLQLGALVREAIRRELERLEMVRLGRELERRLQEQEGAA